MTEKFSAGRCSKCGGCVGFEDEIRQDTCRCDPVCGLCGRRLIILPGRIEKRTCDECIEGELAEGFSEEFLNSLDRGQLRLLIRDTARRLEQW